MQQVFSIPKSMKKDFRYTFCPGCDHGIVIRLVAEVIDELGIREDMISSTSVGCSVFLYDFLKYRLCRSSSRESIGIRNRSKKSQT